MLTFGAGRQRTTPTYRSLCLSLRRSLWFLGLLLLRTRVRGASLHPSVFYYHTDRSCQGAETNASGRGSEDDSCLSPTAAAAAAAAAAAVTIDTLVKYFYMIAALENKFVWYAFYFGRVGGSSNLRVFICTYQNIVILRERFAGLFSSRMANKIILRSTVDVSTKRCLDCFNFSPRALSNSPCGGEPRRSQTRPPAVQFRGFAP